MTARPGGGTILEGIDHDPVNSVPLERALIYRIMKWPRCEVSRHIGIA
ncbi:MAG: hypothetical protein J2P28_11250 [Actinobacteria bacterium]|nr:hypothetical protein [Actinomycetota bacterium]